jgi:hypothetical protein
LTTALPPEIAGAVEPKVLDVVFISALSEERTVSFKAVFVALAAPFPPLNKLEKSSKILLIALIRHKWYYCYIKVSDLRN